MNPQHSSPLRSHAIFLQLMAAQDAWRHASMEEKEAAEKQLQSLSRTALHTLQQSMSHYASQLANEPGDIHRDRQLGILQSNQSLVLAGLNMSYFPSHILSVSEVIIPLILQDLETEQVSMDSEGISREALSSFQQAILEESVCQESYTQSAEQRQEEANERHSRNPEHAADIQRYQVMSRDFYQAQAAYQEARRDLAQAHAACGLAREALDSRLDYLFSMYHAHLSHSTGREEKQEKINSLLTSPPLRRSIRYYQQFIQRHMRLLPNTHALLSQMGEAKVRSTLLGILSILEESILSIIKSVEYFQPHTFIVSQHLSLLSKVHSLLHQCQEKVMNRDNHARICLTFIPLLHDLLKLQWLGEIDVDIDEAEISRLWHGLSLSEEAEKQALKRCEERASVISPLATHLSNIASTVEKDIREKENAHAMVGARLSQAQQRRHQASEHLISRLRSLLLLPQEAEVSVVQDVLEVLQEDEATVSRRLAQEAMLQWAEIPQEEEKEEEREEEPLSLPASFDAMCAAREAYQAGEEGEGSVRWIALVPTITSFIEGLLLSIEREISSPGGCPYLPSLYALSCLLKSAQLLPQTSRYLMPLCETFLPFVYQRCTSNTLTSLEVLPTHHSLLGQLRKTKETLSLREVVYQEAVKTLNAAEQAWEDSQERDEETTQPVARSTTYRVYHALKTRHKYLHTQMIFQWERLVPILSMLRPHRPTMSDLMTDFFREGATGVVVLPEIILNVQSLMGDYWHRWQTAQDNLAAALNASSPLSLQVDHCRVDLTSLKQEMLSRLLLAFHTLHQQCTQAYPSCVVLLNALEHVQRLLSIGQDILEEDPEHKMMIYVMPLLLYLLTSHRLIDFFNNQEFIASCESLISLVKEVQEAKSNHHAEVISVRQERQSRRMQPRERRRLELALRKSRREEKEAQVAHQKIQEKFDQLSHVILLHTEELIRINTTAPQRALLPFLQEAPQDPDAREQGPAHHRRDEEWDADNRDA